MVSLIEPGKYRARLRPANTPSHALLRTLSSRCPKSPVSCRDPFITGNRNSDRLPFSPGMAIYRPCSYSREIRKSGRQGDYQLKGRLLARRLDLHKQVVSRDTNVGIGPTGTLI